MKSATYDLFLCQEGGKWIYAASGASEDHCRQRAEEIAKAKTYGNVIYYKVLQVVAYGIPTDPVPPPPPPIVWS